MDSLDNSAVLDAGESEADQELTFNRPQQQVPSANQLQQTTAAQPTSSPSPPSSPSPALPPAPPRWKDVESAPQFSKLDANQQRFAFSNWIQSSNNYFSQIGFTPDKDQQANLAGYIQQTGRKLGMAIGVKPDNTIETLGDVEKNLGYKTDSDFDSLPYYSVLQKPTGSTQNLETAADSMAQGVRSLFTGPLKTIGALYDWATGTKPGTTMLDQRMAAADQMDKDLSNSQDTSGAQTVLDKTVPHAAGTLMATLIGGYGKILGMAGFSALDALGNKYFDATSEGATPNQAIASAGIAAAISAGELLALDGAGKVASKLAFGKNADLFQAGDYRPTIGESFKYIGADAAAQASLGATGQVAENAFDKWDYNSNLALSTGVADATTQQSFFALMHAPTLFHAFVNASSDIQAASRDQQNAAASLKDAQRSGDPDAIKKAQDAYDTAQSTYSSLIASTAKNAPLPTAQDATDAGSIIMGQNAPESKTTAPVGAPVSSDPIDKYTSDLKAQVDAPVETASSNTLTISPTPVEQATNPADVQTAEAVGPATTKAVLDEQNEHDAEENANGGAEKRAGEQGPVLDQAGLRDDGGSGSGQRQPGADAPSSDGEGNNAPTHEGNVTEGGGEISAPPPLDETQKAPIGDDGKTQAEPVPITSSEEAAVFAESSEGKSDAETLGRDGFQEKDGIWTDPKNKELPSIHQKEINNLTDNLREHGIKGVRVQASSQYPGLWVKPGVDPDTIYVNPEIMSVKGNPESKKAASLEEYWHGIHGKAVKALGQKFGQTFLKIFDEMTPETVRSVANSYSGLYHLAKVPKSKISEEARVQLAGEYARMLQVRNSGEKTVEQVRGDSTPDSIQTKGMMARDKEFLESAPTLSRLLNKSLELDQQGRPNKYESKISESTIPGIGSDTSDNSRAGGDGGEDRFKNLPFFAESPPGLPPEAKSKWDAIKDLALTLRKGVPKFDDWTKAKTQLSATLSRNAQNLTRVMEHIQKQVPDKVKREGITNYIEAKGDVDVLRQRMDATDNPDLRKGYRAALDLTPQEKAMAYQVSDIFALHRQLALKWGIPVNEVENYVTHLWSKDGSGNLKIRGGKSLNASFRFSKQRTNDTYFHGEQNGLIPQTKDISEIVGSYVNELGSAIAARQWVENLTKGKDNTGKPLVAPKFGGLQHLPDEAEKKQAILVMPAHASGEYEHYRSDKLPSFLNQWVWKGSVDGKQVLSKENMSVSPEIYHELQNIFGRSAIKDWLDTPSKGPWTSLGKNVVGGALRLNTIGKTTLFGAIPSLFHPVQIANEAISHRTLTTDIKPPDMNDPETYDKAAHGLMLAPNEASRALFMDGMNMSKDNLVAIAGRLAEQLPGIKDSFIKDGIEKMEKGVEFTQRYLFETFIPSLKSRFYDVVLDRNRERFSKELEAGSVTDDDLKYLTANQANNAFGHLNYVDIARNPTIQHMMQFAFLAPDFFEARLRHTGQALSGALGNKAGWEQSSALLAMGTAMFLTARVANYALNNGDTKLDEPFAVVNGNRSYRMRTQVGDLYGLVGFPVQNGHLAWGGMFKNWRTWTSGRESPMIRFMSEALTGVNYRGEQTSMADAIKDTLAGNLPIPLQGLVKPVTDQLPQSWQDFIAPKNAKNNPISPFEQFLGSTGIQISRYSPITQVYPLAKEWVANHGEEIGLKPETATYPTSQYTPLKYALDDGNLSKAWDEYQSLVKANNGNAQKVAKGAVQSINSYFTGKKQGDEAMYLSLTPDQQQVYKAAMDRRVILEDRFSAMFQQFQK